jgi:ABC-type glucose/galactose transport system permease subunit
MKNKLTFLIYGITLFFITLSGFAQMPIFERYHISNIPGFGWLADFYVTHLVHYAFAAVLIAWGVYRMMTGLMLKTKMDQRSFVTAILLGGLMITGVLMVIKNFSGTPFPFGVIIALDLLHLMFCMAFLMFGGYQLMKQKKP